jgi:hypothetical protein
MYIPVCGYMTVEHSVLNEKRQHTKNCSLHEKSDVAEHNSAPRRGHEQVWALQYSPAIVKKSHKITEVCIRNNNPWTNKNSNVCGQNT